MKVTLKVLCIFVNYLYCKNYLYYYYFLQTFCDDKDLTINNPKKVPPQSNHKEPLEAPSTSKSLLP